MARAVRAPLKELASELLKLRDEGLVVFDEASETFRLTEGPTTESFRDPLCSACGGKGRVLPEAYARALELFRELVADRPSPRTEYDQGYMRPEDVAHRALLMDLYGDLEGRRIVLLGDDDLLSLYLGLLNRASRIMALDLDEDLLGYIEQKGREAGLRVEVRTHDLGRTLPADLRASFDVFSTEPVESLKGLKEFFRRGLEAVAGDEAAGYIGLTVHESSWAKWRAFEGFVVEQGFVITDILPSFSLYPSADWPEEMITGTPLARRLGIPLRHPEEDWYSSSLIRVERAPSMEEVGDLYRDEDTWLTPGAG